MNRKLIFLFLALTMVAAATADSSFWAMKWQVESEINGTVGWLNFTMADLGDQLPQILCFGLANDSVCMTTEPINNNLRGKNIFNATQINTTELCLNGICRTTWIADNTSFNETYTDGTYLRLNKNNWNGDSWITYTQPNFIFNESKLATQYFNVTSFSAQIGSYQGTLHHLNTYDDNPLNVTENALSGLDFRTNFTGISAFNQFIFRYKSTVGENHIIKVQLYDYSTSTWENYATLGEVTDYDIKTIGVYDDDEHISGGIVQLRFYQQGNGNVNHKHYFDWIVLANGYATPSGAEIDPFSIHTTAINTTQFYYDGTLNLNQTFLETLSSGGGNVSGTGIVNNIAVWNSTSNLSVSSGVQVYIDTDGVLTVEG